jgi:hypothetical protein
VDAGHVRVAVAGGGARGRGLVEAAQVVVGEVHVRRRGVLLR